MSRRRLRRDDRLKKPQFIDYNPNLPPAAFPTLDIIPKRGSDNNGAQQDRNASESIDDLCSLTNSENQEEESLVDCLGGIPMDQLDNCMVSNGELNPIWVSNMARMEAAGQNAYGDMDMEDTDLDGTVTEEIKISSTGSQGPSWADLSDRMQAEILAKLLDRYSYPTACRMLGLTTQELIVVHDCLEYRREQAELEDAELEAMREKQWRDLSRIDNSLRVQNQSSQLDFWKASRQTFRGLREVMDPKVDFFGCEASELTAAKTFLRKREIEAKFAGVWGNEIALVHTSKKGGSLETVGLDGGSGPPLITDVGLTSGEVHPPTTIKLTPESKISTAMKEIFLNQLADPPTSNKLLTVQRNGDPTTPPRWLTHLFNEKVDPERKYSEMKKRQEYDIVYRQDRCSVPSDALSIKKPLLDYSFSEELALRPRQQSNTTAQRTNSSLSHEMALLSSAKDKKILGLELDNHLQRPNSGPSSQRAGLSAPLYRRVPSASPQKPEEAEQHTQRQKSEQGQTSTTKDTENGIHSNLTNLSRIWAFIPLSPSPTPTHLEVNPSSSPETELFQFSNPTSPQTVTTHSSSPTSAVSSTLAGEDRDNSENDDDELMLEDEMVLLPTSH